MPAGTKINIYTDSDVLDNSTGHRLSPEAFAQVASRCSSTEIAADGEESMCSTTTASAGRL